MILRKSLIIIIFFLSTNSITSLGQNKDSAEIIDLLHQQQQAWNDGNIVTFMKGYWENDSLMFVGKSGITYGYNNTLNNYIKGYPDTTAMGKLQFDILEVGPLSRQYYFVVGKWTLKRTIGNIGGHFTLLFRKIKNEWKIIADHSS